MRKMSRAQIVKTLEAVKGLTYGPVTSEWDNTFYVEHHEIICANDKVKNKVLKAMQAAGRSFGGYKAGWGGWHLTENYTITTTMSLISQNCD